MVNKLVTIRNPETTYTQQVELSDTPMVYVSLPVTNESGKKVARVDGLFVLSDEAIKDARIGILRAVIATLFIVLVSVAMIYPVMVRLFFQISRLTKDLLHSNLEILQVLGSAIAKRDSDTDAHNYRVTLFSVALAERVGLPEQDMRPLIKGAFLHDVGKIGIRDEILLKSGKLDADEFEIMKTHVTHGLDIIGRSKWLEDARDIVGGHQERYDGNGYCNGLKAGKIPLGARIFAIADVFDALTSKRPYKEPFSLDKSMEILREGDGTHFDSKLLDAFLEIAPELYENLSGIENDKIKQILAEVIDRYFYQEINQVLQSV